MIGLTEFTFDGSPLSPDEAKGGLHRGATCVVGDAVTVRIYPGDLAIWERSDGSGSATSGDYLEEGTQRRSVDALRVRARSSANAAQLCLIYEISYRIFALPPPRSRATFQ